MDFVKNAMSGGSKDEKKASGSGGEQKEDYVDKGMYRNSIYCLHCPPPCQGLTILLSLGRHLQEGWPRLRPRDR